MLSGVQEYVAEYWSNILIIRLKSTVSGLNIPNIQEEFGRKSTLQLISDQTCSLAGGILGDFRLGSDADFHHVTDIC